MKLFSMDDFIYLVVMLSVPSAGILFYLVYRLVSWNADSDYESFCGRGQPEGRQCEFEFLEITLDLLNIWVISVSATVLPLLALVTVLVILVRWIRSLGAPAEKR